MSTSAEFCDRAMGGLLPEPAERTPNCDDEALPATSRRLGSVSESSARGVARMASPSALRAKWSARQYEWRELRVQVDGAAVAAEILADIDAIETSVADELLPLAAAARESGYSCDHLARLIRNGSIPNAGRRSAPRIRRGDLPRKARRIEGERQSTYDPQTDARDLVSRRNGGTR